MWPCTSRSPLGHGCKDCEIVVIPCRRSDGPNPPHWPQEFHHKNDALNVDDTNMLQKCFTIFWLPVSIQSRYAFHGTQICVCVCTYIYIRMYISKCIVRHMKSNIWYKLQLVKSINLMFPICINFGFHLVWHPEGELPCVVQPLRMDPGSISNVGNLRFVWRGHFSSHS